MAKAISTILWALVVVSLIFQSINIITIVSVGFMLATLIYVSIYNDMMKYIKKCI